MRSAYRVIAILAVIMIAAGILSSFVAIAVAGSITNLAHDTDIWWNDTEIHLPAFHIDDGNIKIGDEDGGITIDKSQINIGDKENGIHITINGDGHDGKSN